MWLYKFLSDYMQCKDMRDNLDQIGIATTTITATTSTEVFLVHNKQLIIECLVRLALEKERKRMVGWRDGRMMRKAIRRTRKYACSTEATRNMEG